MDKFTLLYEFNRESPLITYEAAKEFEKHNFEKAVELFEISINKFPYYPTTYFLYAAVLANINEFDKAKELILRGDDLLNEKKTYEYYSQLVEKLRLQNLGIDTAINSDNINIEFSNIDNEIVETDNSDFIDENDETSMVSEDSYAKPIVTETLAEIYASQGNFTEALDIYSKLKNQKPEFKEKFENRIREINAAIENKKQNRFGNSQ